MTLSTRVPPLPAAVGVTHLMVYDSLTPDGLIGGSPHMHIVCTELYLVVAGRGRVQTLTYRGFAETPLAPGMAVWFTPGTIHRLINDDGRLEIQIVMQNAGLPEAGDFVLTFPLAVLRDPAAYADAASLSPRGEVFASSQAAALRRRDLAVTGFAELRAAYERDGPDALDAFFAVALPLIQPKLAQWQAVWRAGPLAEAQATGAHLTAVGQGMFAHLRDGAVMVLPPPGATRRLGVCGTLGPYLPEGAALAGT